MTSSLNVSGSWTLTDCCTSFNVVLNQDQASNITGSVDVSASDLCDSYDKAVWPISGAVTGSNTFSFTATNPGVSNSDCYAVWQIDATTTSDTTATAEFDLLLDDGPHLIGNMTRKPVPIKLIDPVASGLIDGEAVTQNVDAIAAAPNPIYVAGVSADGVSQVIIEVTHVQPGDSVQLTLVNENGQQDSTANDGA